MQQTIEKKAKRVIAKEQKRKIKLLHQYVVTSHANFIENPTKPQPNSD